MGAPTLLDGKEREAQEVAGEGVIEVDDKLVTKAPQSVVERGPVDVELLAGTQFGQVVFEQRTQCRLVLGAVSRIVRARLQQCQRLQVPGGKLLG